MDGTYALAFTATDDDADVGTASDSITVETISAPLDAQAVLPLRVFSNGLSPTSATIDLDVADQPNADVLYLRIHAPVYRDVSINPRPKFRVRLDAKPWVDIANSAVDVYAHEAAYGGLDGTYHTVRMTIPAADLGGFVSGDNTLEVQFIGTDGVTSGGRVVELDVRDATDSSSVLTAPLTLEDPLGWTPIYTDADSVAAGSALWRARNSLTRSSIDAGSLVASCNDCHAENGLDLWYYNFDDKSIVARSQFHGYTEQQGRLIASYIRSHATLYGPGYDPPGRPWNPPFQPGPGRDLLPVHQWAAGSGIDGVLEDDDETVDYASAALDSLAVTATLRMGNIPIAIQLPDWNEWVPDEHPLDMLTYGDDFEDLNMWTDYVHARDVLSTTAPEDVTDLHDLINEIAREAKRYRKDVKGTALAPPDAPDKPWEEFQRSLFHWAAVKTWELNREFSLEDDQGLVYAPYDEPRGWIGGDRNPFDLAPHIITKDGFWFHTKHVGKYFSTAWYSAQTSIFNGNTVETGEIGPIDWNYHPNHVFGLPKEGGPAHPYRALYSLQKMNQLLYHYEDSGYNEDFGIRWRQAHPGRYNPGSSDQVDYYADAEPVRLGQTFDRMLSEFMDRLDAAGGPSAWDGRRRVDTDGDGGYCDEDESKLKPATWDGDTGGGCTDDWVDPVSGDMRTNEVTANGRYAEMWLWMIPQYRDAGVTEATLGRLIDWGAGVWPLGPWADVCDAGTPGTVCAMNVTLFAALTLALAVLGGLVDGLRLTTIAEYRRGSLGRNKLWHRLQFAREAVIGLACALFYFDGWAVLAGLAVYGSWRWVAFDVAHAAAVGREPLEEGTVADTDRLLARLPVWARLALYLACAIGSAWWLWAVTP